MKPSPDIQKLEAAIRASKIVAGGFMGGDPRPLDEILEADAAELARLKRTPHEIAARMRHILDRAEPGLGAWVRIDETVEASVTDTRGAMPCPWPHPGTFPKTVTTARNMRTARTIQWSAINIHLIEAHGFFEGRGAVFRLEPRDLVAVIFQKQS